MYEFLQTFGQTTIATLRDVAPIVAILLGFQWLVLRRWPPNLRRIASGLVYVLLGLTLFLVGLEEALFPLGETMAQQLTALALSGAESGVAPGTASATEPNWRDYAWVYAFAAAIGFATTVAEPALIAVAAKAAEVAGAAGFIPNDEAARLDYAFELRLTVALSVGASLVLGVFRILKGWPIHYLIISGYLIVVIITGFAPPEIVGIAHDSGGVTTSTMTVPLVTALGVGLATVIRGRNPLLDGFGLIAFASLMPIIFVLLFGMVV